MEALAPVGGGSGQCDRLWGEVVFPGCPHLALPSPESQLVTTQGWPRPELPSALTLPSVCQRLQPGRLVLSHSSAPRFHTATSARGAVRASPTRETEADSHRSLRRQDSCGRAGESVGGRC